MTSADSFIRALLNTNTLIKRHFEQRCLSSRARKTRVQTQGKRENGVLHTNVSLDRLDKRAQLGATAAKTKTSLVEAGIHRRRRREKLPAAGFINRASVWELWASQHPDPKIREQSVKQPVHHWQKTSRVPCLLSLSTPPPQLKAL